MNKAVEAAQKMGEAVSDMGNVMNVYGVRVRDNKIYIHLGSLRDLEQVPGELKVRPFDMGEFPSEAVKAISTPDGLYDVEFFVLLREDEMEMAS